MFMQQRLTGMFVTVTTVTCTVSVPKVKSGPVIPAAHFSALIPRAQLQHTGVGLQKCDPHLTMNID
jgi:hypothetical protein